MPGASSSGLSSDYNYPEMTQPYTTEVMSWYTIEP